MSEQPVVSPTTARPSAGSDLKAWFGTTWKPLAMFAGALGVVAGTSQLSNRLLWVFPLAALLYATTWMGTVSQAERRRNNFRVRRGRVLLNAIILTTVVSGAITLRCAHLTRGPVFISVVVFIGVGLAFLAAGGLIAELRAWRWWWRGRGPTLLAAGTVLVGVALRIDPLGTGDLLKVLLAAGITAVLVGGETISEAWLLRRTWSLDPILPVAAAAVGAGGTAVLVDHCGWGLGIVAAGVTIAATLSLAVRWLRRQQPTQLPPLERLEDAAPEPAVWKGFAAIGGAVLAAAVVVLSVLGVAPMTALAIVLGLFVVVWFVAARSDNLLITMVVALALLWAGTPRTEGVTAAAKPTPAAPYFVAFGDSYMSGEGAATFHKGTNTKSKNEERTNECRRANTAWPILLAGSHVVGLPSKVLFVACSGAVADQLRKAPRVDKKRRWTKAAELELWRREAPTANDAPKFPMFAVVSIGGNDAHFSTLGKTCVGPGNCAEFEKAFMASLKGLPATLDGAYHDINELFTGQVPIIAIPYPDPIAAGEAECSVFLEGAERDFISRYVTALNGTIRKAAERWGFEFMETIPGALADAGSRLCDGAGAAGVNFISWHPQGGSIGDALIPTNWTHNSLHPNESGHRLMRDAAERWFTTHPQRKIPGTAQRITVTDPDDKAPPPIVSNDWLPRQAQGLGNRVAVPLAMALVGSWLIIIVMVRRAAQRRWSLAGKVREAAKWVLAAPPADVSLAAAAAAPAKKAPAKKAPAKNV